MGERLKVINPFTTIVNHGIYSLSYLEMTRCHFD